MVIGNNKNLIAKITEKASIMIGILKTKSAFSSLPLSKKEKYEKRN